MCPMDTQELAQLAAFGLEKMIEELQGKLAVVKGMAAPPVNGHPRRRGRPPKTLLLAAGVTAPAEGKLASGWPADPEERRREMARRMAKWHQPKTAPQREHKMHPRDRAHPDHAAWAAKMRAAQKKVWNRMTVAERKKRAADIAAGRQHNKPSVKLEATA